jgi:hypothetical protein
MKIKVIKKIQTSAKQWIAQGEVFEARRVTTKLLDFNAPFQIISGPFAGEEIPFKLALVLPHEPHPTQQQFDELAKQNGELLDKLDRQTAEQLNSEKLLQRIRELETIANERDEMIKSIKSVSVVIRDKRNPVEVPRDVANALDWCQWNGVDNDEIVRNLATGINGPIMNVLRSYVHEGGNGHNLLCALLNGHIIAPENDELADEIDSLTSVWFHNVVKSGGDIETNRQHLNQVIYEFMRGLDKTAV